MFKRGLAFADFCWQSASNIVHGVRQKAVNFRDIQKTSAFQFMLFQDAFTVGVKKFVGHHTG